MFGIGLPEFMAFSLVALLLFGHRLPGVMRSLGRGICEFRDAVRSTDDTAERLA
jgi:sec-independent protein translocase protein TatA